MRISRKFYIAFILFLLVVVGIIVLNRYFFSPKPLLETKLNAEIASQPSMRASIDTVQQKIGPGVIEALQSTGEARVVIALQNPPSSQSTPPNLPKTRSEIAELQDSVLARLDSLDFRLSHKYEAIPALAGTVLSESGLAKLVANPGVIRIDLDVGGSGSR